VKKGILRTLGVIVTLALMLVLVPASIASAAIVNSLTVINTQGTLATNPYLGLAKGQVGDRFSFTLLGSVSTNFTLYFSNQKAIEGEHIGTKVTTYKQWEGVALTSGGGSVQITTLTIPGSLTDGPVNLTSLHGGIYYFYVVEYHPTEGSVAAYSDTKILKVAEFEIVGIADAEIDKTTGKVGTVVTVSGSGFAPNEYIIINYYHTTTNYATIDTIFSGSDQVAANGTFQLGFAIPESVNGKHNIVVQGESSRASEAFEFTVTPSVTLSKSSGQGGDTVIIYAKGFLRSSDVDISIGGIKLDVDDSTSVSDKTDTTGSLTYIVTIPASLGSGTYDVLVRDETTSSVSATTPFEIDLASELEISESTGNVGDTVTVNGTCYAAGSTVTIYYDDVSVGTATVNSSGAFTKEITIPESTCGAHIIKVGTVEETFTVEAVMTIDITEGIAGTEVTIEGTGFQGDTDISLEFDGDDVDIEDGDEVTDENGSFSLSFIVPSLAPGSYDIDITAGPKKSAEFEIPDATIELGATEGEVGDTIIVTGANFAAGSTITFAIDGEAVATLPTPVTADTDGSFAASFDIPTIAGGAHTLTVSDGATSKTAEFTVNATATMTPTLGNVGTQVTIIGEGFIANNTITITYNGTALQSDTPVTTDEDGIFTATFNVPASPGGERTVNVSDDTNSVQFTFNMETTAPPAPTLTAPESASKQKGIVTFEWTPVTDSSMPVTYTLQVASDSAFTNKVVEHGLSETTYTLTEAEKLTKLPDGGQYYWRVIATDAASNTSESAAGTFVVGGGLPGWLMWLWIGIGVVVVFIFAIWLGRRLAYSSY